jgi:hypothetical protein
MLRRVPVSLRDVERRPVMSATLTAAEVLDRVYLEVRCRFLDVAACLDRIDRAEDVAKDPRYQQLRRGIELLLAESPNRAEQIQMLFSDTYEANWNRKKAAPSGKG